MQNQNSLIDRFIGWHDTTPDTRHKLLTAFCQGITSRSIILNMVAMAVLHIFLSDAIPVLSWLAWIALITLCGMAIRLFARHVESNPAYFEDPRRTAAILLLFGGIYGLTWGLGLSFFFWSGSPLDKGIVLFVTAFSATIGPYAPMPGFSQMRFVVTVIPFLISVILIGDWMFGLLVLVLSAWLYLLFGYTHSNRKILTAQYELASELETRDRQLNQANQVKDDFLAEMSHELRTPLNGILGMARLQRTETLSEENLNRSNLIENSGRTLLNIIDGIPDPNEASHQAPETEHSVPDRQYEKTGIPLEAPVVEGETASSTPVSVLLVEDLVMNQIVATQMLENDGHDITIAASGAEAIETFRRGSFDVILLDINLPDMGGVKVAEKIRATDAIIPIYAVTANTFASDQQIYLDAGMNGVIRKPLEQEELDRCLASIATANNNDSGNEANSVEDITDDYSILDVVDIKYLDKMRLEVGDEVIRQMLDIFEAQAPEALGELHTAIQDGDMAGVQIRAHKLASMSGSVALLKLSMTFSALEQLAQDDDLSGTDRAAKSLEALMTRSCQEILACLERPRQDA